MAIRLEMRPNEPIDKALKRFKKMCDREGLNRDIRRNAYYEKDSEKNKRKNREREKELAKQVRLAARAKAKRKKRR
ncbi:MAG: 30S ribosomal protein S21 [Planctomycetota bacterium]